MPNSNCPSRDDLSGFVVGTIPENAVQAIADHVDSCPACEATISQLEAASDTVVSSLREQPAQDEFTREAACQRAVALVEAIGRDPTSAPAGEFAGRVPGVEPRGTSGEPPAAELPFAGGSKTRPQPPEDLGTIRDYRLLAKLGEGGMGTVYRALHTQLDKVVALKVLPADRMKNAEAVARFKREMKAVGKLDHPNIVRATDAGEQNGTHYLVMELVEGIDLSRLVKQHGPLPIPDACELIRQAAVGLECAHEHGLVHRDIKPSNLMLAVTQARSASEGKQPATFARASGLSSLNPEPRLLNPLLKILDLGLALLQDEIHPGEELTASGQMMGTVDYMAPEQAADTHTVDIRADIYSLGCTLYKLLTGHAPFDDPQFNTPFKKMMAHTQTPVPPVQARRRLGFSLTKPTSKASPPVDGVRLKPNLQESPQPDDEVPVGLIAVLDRMLAKNPTDRFATPAAVAAALEPFTADSDLPRLVAAVQAGQSATPVTEPITTTSDYASSPLTGTASSVARPESSKGVAASAESPPRPSRTQGVPHVRTPKGRWLPLAAAAAALCAVLAGGGVYRIATDKGELIIKSDEPGVEVTIKRDGKPVENLEVSHGQTKTTVRSGEIEVVITGANADTFVATSDQTGEPRFTLTRAGKVVVEIERKGGTSSSAAKGVADSTKPATPVADSGRATATADPDRRAAEWALSIGGSIRVGVGDQGRDISALANLPKDSIQLTGVILGGNQKVTDAGLAHFKDCKNLTVLHLNNTQVTNAGLAHFKDCKNLTNLHLYSTQVTDAGLAHFKDCKNLTVLLLVKTQVTDAGLAHFQDCKNLATLDLQNTQVTDAGLAHFQDCKNLTDLNLYAVPVTDAGLAHFKDCKNLTVLNLCATPVTDAGLAHFKDCKNLMTLRLNSTQVTDAGLAHFKDCKNLTEFDLGGTRVTDAGLAHLKDCKNLMVLNLGGTQQVTDAGLAHFKDYKNLAALRLNNTQVTDAALAHFKDLTNLLELNVNNTRVSDAELELLASLPNLNLLQLLETRISAGGFATLKAAFPKAQIEWSEPNHTAAEAVLALGGSVHVRLKGHEDDQPVKTAAELPAEYFQVSRVSLAAVQKPLGDLLVKLAALSDPEFDRLESLDLCGQPVSDSDMANVKRLTSLTELALARTQVSDAGLAQLKDLKTLRRLVLDGCTIRGQGLTHLKELPELADLGLACPTLTDLFAGSLAELKQLQKLSLAGSGVSDKALQPLGGLTNLRELDLTGTKVTASGVAKLQEALPNCKIVWDGGESESGNK